MYTTEQLLERYLEQNDVNIKVADYVKVIPATIESNENVNDSLFDNIIVDGFNGFAEEVKNISNFVTDNFKTYLGRRDKTIIKKILDYECYDLISSINISPLFKDSLENQLLSLRSNSYERLNSCKNIFFKQLKIEIDKKNTIRVSDYLNFLYSKALIFNEFENRSAYDIYIENKEYLSKFLDKKRFVKFENACKKKKNKLPYSRAVESFNNLYQKEILDLGEKVNEVIAFNLDQKIFDSFNSKEDFFSYTFELIKSAYSKLQNHRTLIVKVENIIFQSVNIKWEVYSFLTIYAENFINYQENRQYYKPEEICLNFIEHKYNFKPSEEIEIKLKDYYNNKVAFNELDTLIEFKILKSDIDFFKDVYTGFHFIDCFVIKSDNSFQNTEEIAFVENKNEIMLVFSKHQIDDRKIPCPVCASLKISGNSYPSIGIKSWECKNHLCSERSKTNRGKRYSSRSNDMQVGVSEENKFNLISKELISKWRKDIVTADSSSSLIEMIVKYFSYHEGSIEFFNFNEKNYNIPKDLFRSRKITFNNLFEKYPKNNFNSDNFPSFIKGDLLSKFIYDNEELTKNKDNKPLTIEEYNIINSDCLSYLKSLPPNSISHMVTSPPYYNAREYSQWKNMYNYLNDMYKICLSSFAALKPGGVFFYNIGDIFDNPNTIVKSKMGEKRLPLGAYLILLFKCSGFELLDNIVWDKGETQSNRHKNDGNFTPYYQRPANCYEHMFIFKKPGALSVCTSPLLKENIQKFSPVIKINSKGENLFGHTAPFPPELPLISIKTFTNENDIVFDPFLGSGTTVYTAVKNNRRGLGTEMDKNYFELASSNILKKLKDSFQSELF
jgi:DNA modification methylase